MFDVSIGVAVRRRGFTLKVQQEVAAADMICFQFDLDDFVPLLTGDIRVEQFVLRQRALNVRLVGEQTNVQVVVVLDRFLEHKQA